MKTQTKHTPGPWRISLNNTDGQYQIFQGPEDKHCAWIASVTQTVIDFDRRMSKEEGQANARLIASAPELLEIGNKISDCYGNQGGHVYSEIIQELRRAIAKAEGK